MNRRFLKNILEFLIIGALACFFLEKVIICKLDLGGKLPECPDHWLSCFTMESQITRILGKNHGGLWNGGYFFPFHKLSFLFNEPTWGVSLAILPIWFILRDVFFINHIIGIPALILCWISIFYFAKALGCKRIFAFFAAMTFCLSGASLALITDVYFFWPFFLIPCLGLLIIKIYKSPRIIWGILLGIGFGYLAWSSAHLTIMGGSFLFLVGLWYLRFNNRSGHKYIPIFYALLISIILASIIYIPMFIIHNKFGRGIPYIEQFLYATNWDNLFYTDKQWERPFNLFKKIGFWNNISNHAKGEIPIGISIFVFLLAVFFFAVFLLRIENGRKNNSNYLRILSYYISPLFLAMINILVLRFSLAFNHMAQVDILKTLFYYGTFGALIALLRKRIFMALRQPAFFFLGVALFMAFLSFGPFYVSPNAKLVPSPLIILLYVLPGFSGIRATARWGIMFSLCLSLGVSLALSKEKTNYLFTALFFIAIALSSLELFPGLYLGRPNMPKLHQWKPREVDIFLKNIENKGAVLELPSYPVSLHSLGPDLYSSLYHKRPVVTGYATLTPKVSDSFLYNPEGRFYSEIILQLRKFGACYWVLHMDTWNKEDNFHPGEYLWGLKRIAILDDGKTLIYEDPEPKISVTPFGQIN